jgi:hypothetical protein
MWFGGEKRFVIRPRDIFIIALYGVLLPTQSLMGHLYSVMQFEQLNLTSLHPETEPKKSDDQRCVFSDEKFIYKIWNADYDRSECFVRACEEGYFQNLTQIVSLIFDSNQKCRGYIMPKGRPLEITHLSPSEAVYTVSEAGTIVSWDIYDVRYHALLSAAISSLDTSSFVFLDFSPYNIVEIDRKYYLMDLDSVYSFEEVQEWSSNKSGYLHFVLSCGPTEYENAVIRKLTRKN